MNELNWHKYFFQMCDFVATKSKDRATKIGAIIVGPDNEIRSTGYNGFPRGINDDIDDRHNRPNKYMYTEHAERNAIYSAARTSISVNKCRMYIDYYPCADCARAIIQSGISKILINKRDWENRVAYWEQRWKESCDCAKEMLHEANIEIELVEIE